MRIVYKVVRPTEWPDVYHSATTENADWVVIYKPGMWATPQPGKEHSLLLCFGTYEDALKFHNGSLLIFEAEADGFITPMRHLARFWSMRDFWDGELIYQTTVPPDGTLGAERVRLTRRITQ